MKEYKILEVLHEQTCINKKGASVWVTVRADCDGETGEQTMILRPDVWHEMKVNGFYYQ